MDIRHLVNSRTVQSVEGVKFVQNTSPLSYLDQKGRTGLGYVSQNFIAAGYPELTTSLPRKGEVEATHEIAGKTVVSAADVIIIPNHDQIIGYLHLALQYALAEIEALKVIVNKKGS